MLTPKACVRVCVCVRIKGVCGCRCRCVCWCDALVRKLATCTDIALVLLECLSEHACLSTHIRISFSGFLASFPSLPSYTKSQLAIKLLIATGSPFIAPLRAIGKLKVNVQIC